MTNPDGYFLMGHWSCKSKFGVQFVFFGRFSSRNFVLCFELFPSAISSSLVIVGLSMFHFEAWIFSWSNLVSLFFHVKFVGLWQRFPAWFQDKNIKWVLTFFQPWCNPPNFQTLAIYSCTLQGCLSQNFLMSSNGTLKMTEINTRPGMDYTEEVLEDGLEVPNVIGGNKVTRYPFQLNYNFTKVCMFFQNIQCRKKCVEKSVI